MMGSNTEMNGRKIIVRIEKGEFCPISSGSLLALAKLVSCRAVFLISGAILTPGKDCDSCYFCKTTER